MNATKSLQKVLKDKNVNVDNEKVSYESSNTMLVQSYSKRLNFARGLVEKQNKEALTLFDDVEEYLAKQLDATNRIYVRAPLNRNVGQCRKVASNLLTLLQPLMILSIYDDSNDSKEKLETMVDLMTTFFENDSGEELEDEETWQYEHTR